jgi:hypothetical protein
MMQYLVAIHQPDDYDPAIAEDEEINRAFDVLNEEMMAEALWEYGTWYIEAR